MIDLAARNKDDALLMYCIRTISKKGFHRELVKRMEPAEYYAVFNSMLQSEVSVVGKTAISASNDVDTSIGLEELVNDLRRTCTATSYTYLYSIEVSGGPIVGKCVCPATLKYCAPFGAVCRCFEPWSPWLRKTKQPLMAQKERDFDAP